MVTVYNLTVRPTAEDTTSLWHRTWRNLVGTHLEAFPHWLAFTELEVLYTPLERSNHQSHPVTNPMSYSTDLPVR